MSAKERAESIKQEGNQALLSADYRSACELYTKAALLDKRNPTIFSNRSKARLELRDFHGAVADAETAIALDPTWGKGHFRAAEVYSATGNWDKAVAHYACSLELQRAAGADVVTVEQRLTSARERLETQLQTTRLAPAVGGAAGLLLGVLLLVLDAKGRAPILQRWFVAIPALMFVAGASAACGWCYVYFEGLKRESYLLKKESGAGGASGVGFGGAPGFGAAAVGAEGGAAPGAGDGQPSPYGKPRPRRKKVERKPPWAKS